MAVTIQYLRLDSSYDPSFDPQNSLTNLQAVTQAVQTRLRLFLGEWWENQNLGLPVFQSMLGQLGTARTQLEMNLAIQHNIRGGPYVTGVDGIVTTFNNGQYSFTANVQTIFGTVSVTTSASSLET